MDIFQQLSFSIVGSILLATAFFCLLVLIDIAVEVADDKIGVKNKDMKE